MSGLMDYVESILNPAKRVMDAYDYLDENYGPTSHERDSMKLDYPYEPGLTDVSLDVASMGVPIARTLGGLGRAVGKVTLGSNAMRPAHVGILPNKLQIDTAEATDKLRNVNANANLAKWAGDSKLNHGWRGDSQVHEAYDGMKNRTSVHNLLGTYISRDKSIAEGYANRSRIRNGGKPFNQELLFKTKKLLDWDDPLHAANTANVKDAYKFGFDDDRIARIFGQNKPRITYTDLVKFAENKYIASQGMKNAGFDGISFARGDNVLLFDNNAMKAIDNPGGWSLTDNRLMKAMIPGLLGAEAYKGGLDGR